MKLLTKLDSSHPEREDGDYGIVDLTPETAAKLLDLHARAWEFRRSIEAAGLASGTGAVRVQSGLAHFSAYQIGGMGEALTSEVEEALGDEDWVEASPEIADGLATKEEAGVRLDEAYAIIHESAVVFGANHHYSGSFFRTGDLPVALLMEVATEVQALPVEQAPAARKNVR